MVHWNIQINIQRVAEIPQPAPVTRGYQNPQEPRPKADRRVTNLLELKVTAGSEAEAYAKAHRMLTANQPDAPQA